MSDTKAVELARRILADELYCTSERGYADICTLARAVLDARAEIERLRRIVYYECGCPRTTGQAISCNGCGTLREVPSRTALAGEEDQ